MIHFIQTLCFPFWVGLHLTSYDYSQEGEENLTIQSNELKIFIDCYDCDLDYIKTEITFVNYVINRQDSEVHVLVTTQKTGSGGSEYTLSFIGQKEFLGMEDTLKFVSEPVSTEDEIRREFVRVLKMGLIRYVSKTPLSDQISISFKEKFVPTSLQDPWDYWVFRAKVNSYFNGEKSRNFLTIYGNLSANRITNNWKIITTSYFSYNESKFAIGEVQTKSVSESRGVNGMIVKSLSDHFSTGISGSGSSSTFSNEKLSLFLAPAIEFNLFPYSESTRRELRFLYEAGVNPVRYEEETIFGKTEETLFKEELSITLDQSEPWGSVSSTLSGSNYFHDFHKNRLTLFSELSLRLFKGFSLNLYGSASRIRNQLSLAKGELSPEEIYLQVRQLETSYDYFGSVGLSYTFGSIYSSIVNPRFGN